LLADNHSQSWHYALAGIKRGTFYHFEHIKTKVQMGNFKYPIEIAKRDVDRWRQTSKINGFAVKKAELREIMDANGMEDMTVYFGLNELGEMKMFLVADKSVGTVRGNSTEEDTNVGDDADQFVYDFTHPCPPTCDDNSPLN
jgi:hypothetical protein